MSFLSVLSAVLFFVVAQDSFAWTSKEECEVAMAVQCENICRVSTTRDYDTCMGECVPKKIAVACSSIPEDGK